MAYTKTNWVNDSQPPISADNLNNMENGIFNANALADNIDDAYDDTATYAVGDYAIYNNTLYKCTTAVTSAEPFDSSKWSSVSVMDEIGQNASAISALNSRISVTQAQVIPETGLTVTRNIIKKMGNVVDIQYNVGSYTPSSTGWVSCGTLPSGYAPSYVRDFVIADNNTTVSQLKFLVVRIDTTGRILIWSTGGAISPLVAFTYVL